MSFTFDESGVALTESRDGVTMPIDCSFDKVNDWIHGTDVQFEEVHALCLGMATENDSLRSELAALVEALELALEYWADRQQRYKNRSPLWVQKARAALSAYREKRA